MRPIIVGDPEPRMKATSGAIIVLVIRCLAVRGKSLIILNHRNLDFHAGENRDSCKTWDELVYMRALTSTANPVAKNVGK